jgi:predicted HTH domain antitoxin
VSVTTNPDRHGTPSEADLLQELAAVLYEQDKLALGPAARVAGMDEWSFACMVAARKAPMRYELAAFERDLAALQRLSDR